MAAGGNGQLCVPPGFRFHPTDEELLSYYLRKKVSYEAIDLDVIREVDLNNFEPWDLKGTDHIFYYLIYTYSYSYIHDYLILILFRNAYIYI